MKEKTDCGAGKVRVQPLIRVLEEQCKVIEHELGSGWPGAVSVVVRHKALQGRDLEFLLEEV